MLIVFMGVAGAGKTTLGGRFAAAVGAGFHDADDFHSPEVVAKMRSGQPLSDADRAPWLERLAALIERIGPAEDPVVLACSALRASYRARLRAAAETAGIDIVFVYLSVTPEAATARLKRRRNHFMPPSLVESQFSALEPPDDAIIVDAALAPALVIEQIRKQLATRLVRRSS